jgi:exopolysaccharide biosynthesis protein
LRQNNQPEMITPNLEERSRQWEQYWFSITCGPRLLTNGRVSVTAQSVRAEGFTTSHLVNPQAPAARSAIGYSQDGKKLYMVTFIDAVSLQRSAEILRDMGAYQAMNLDGGASVALASRGNILYPAGRNLTNVIAVYDSTSVAPAQLQDAWSKFSRGELRPQLP